MGLRDMFFRKGKEEKRPRKYELLKNETLHHDGHVLFRIRALRDFGDIKAGTKGGFIESENNLSHDGDAWVDRGALVFGAGYVGGNNVVSDKLVISEYKPGLAGGPHFVRG